MSTFKITISIFLVLFLYGLTFGNNADSLLDQKANILKTHKHFSAKFTQSRYMAMFRKPLISTGEISFSHPDKILFHYKTPFEAIILLKEGSMKRYRIENGKYIEQPSMEIVAKAITKEVLRYLKGDFTKDFPYTVIHDNKKPLAFLLFPKSSIAQAIFANIELIFSADYTYIEQITLNETGGDYIQIKHEKPIFEPLPKSTFIIE